MSERVGEDQYSQSRVALVFLVITVFCEHNQHEIFKNLLTLKILEASGHAGCVGKHSTCHLSHPHQNLQLNTEQPSFKTT